MRVIFANIDKKSIKKIDEDVKYVLISENGFNIDKYKDLKIKPVLVLYNGSYVVDLENNSVIIDKSIDKNSYKKIIDYSNTHNVNTKVYKKNNNIYEIVITTSNYHRRLIIPYMFKDLIPNVKSITNGNSIYITKKDSSIINAIDEVLNYLNITNNIIDLENLYINVSNEGFYKDNINWKGIELI